MTNKEYWYWLLNLEGIGRKKIETLLAYYETPERIFSGSKEELNSIKKLSEKDVSTILNRSNLKSILKSYEDMVHKGIKFITIEDDDYPRRLLNIYDSPMALYVKGNLPREDHLNIAVVGARNCSDYGKEIAQWFSRELAQYNVNIISGLARGIDGYAHRGALKGLGNTYGVLGCGIDICYPPEHIELYMDIQENGGIISEYGMGVNPKAGFFPMRNRIISGISDGVLVIEAKEKSGSLITVDMGLEQGKSIFAIPGKVTDILSDGCNNLIKMGAKLVTKPTEILDEFFYNYENIQKEDKKNNNLLETDEKIVYASLSLEPKHLEDIIHETGLGLNKVIEILLALQFKNIVKEVVKNYYITRII